MTIDLYRVQVPENSGMPIMTFMECETTENGIVTKFLETEALRYYNHERQLHGFGPISKLPDGTTFSFVRNQV